MSLSSKQALSSARLGQRAWVLFALLLGLCLSGCSSAGEVAAAAPGKILLSVPAAAEPVLAPIGQPELQAVAPLQPALLARLIWQDEFGPRTVVFDTPTGTVKLRQIGAGSMMLKFGEAVVYVNPWSRVANFSQLPKADQIWITDPQPEHLDLHAIRAVSQPGTQLIVDARSAAALQGLLPFIQLRNQVEVNIDQVRLTAVESYRAELQLDGASLLPSNSYLASYGDFRLLLVGQVHFISDLSRIADVDIALLSVDDLTSLSAQQAADLARELQPAAIFPYQYGENEPAQLTGMLRGSGIMVVPLNTTQQADLEPLGLAPDRTAAIAELYLNRSEPDSELLATLFGSEGQADPLLLPDLHTLTPTALQVNYSAYADITLLRLTNSVSNIGDGPLELWGKASPNGATHKVVQRIYDLQQEHQDREVGEFVFHPGHNHWHLDSFALYELWSLQPDGNLDQVVATSDKVSYCLRDIRRVPHPNQALHIGYGSCSYGRQGLSVGWADVYDYYLPGQSIDISAVPDGTYALISTADPYNLIQESDETNNAAVVYLQIQNRSVQVLDSSGS